jgi:hypothetical protein
MSTPIKLVPAKMSALTSELKDFIDCAIVPALVKMYLAETKGQKLVASDGVPFDHRADAFVLTEENKRT